MRRVGWLLSLVLLLPSLGCLTVDETVVAYLGPKGQVDFIAYLDEIRSDEADAALRAKEERQFLADFKSGKFVKQDLEKNGAQDVKLDLLRAQAPFAAVIQARFESFEKAWTLFDFNLPDQLKRATFESIGRDRKIRFRIQRRRPGAGESLSSRSSDFPKHLKLVFSEGAIVETDGFRADDAKRSCLLDSAAYAARSRGNRDFELSVTWRP